MRYVRYIYMNECLYAYAWLYDYIILGVYVFISFTFFCLVNVEFITNILTFHFFKHHLLFPPAWLWDAGWGPIGLIPVVQGVSLRAEVHPGPGAVCGGSPGPAPSSHYLLTFCGDVLCPQMSEMSSLEGLSICLWEFRAKVWPGHSLDSGRSWCFFPFVCHEQNLEGTF